MDQFTKFTWGTVGIISTIFIGILLGMLWALPTYLLWNWLAPIFGLPTLSILQVVGMILLCKFLFQQPNYHIIQEFIKEKK